MDGQIHDSPSAAAGAITGRPTNGWWFWLVDRDPVRSIRKVRHDYLESVADGEGDEVDEEDDEGL